MRNEWPRADMCIVVILQNVARRVDSQRRGVRHI